MQSGIFQFYGLMASLHLHQLMMAMRGRLSAARPLAARLLLARSFATAVPVTSLILMRYSYVEVRCPQRWQQPKLRTNPNETN